MFKLQKMFPGFYVKMEKIIVLEERTEQACHRFEKFS